MILLAFSFHLAKHHFRQTSVEIYQFKPALVNIPDKILSPYITMHGVNGGKIL